MIQCIITKEFSHSSIGSVDQYKPFDSPQSCVLRSFEAVPTKSSFLISNGGCLYCCNNFILLYNPFKSIFAIFIRLYIEICYLGFSKARSLHKSSGEFHSFEREFYFGIHRLPFRRNLGQNFLEDSVLFHSDLYKS